MSDVSNGSIKRNLQLAGKTTFTVSLPKEWAVEQWLEAGDSIHLYPHQDRLIVAPDSLNHSERTTTIDASIGSDAVCRLVRTAYMTGSDQIVVTDPDEFDRDERRNLTRLIDHLLGMEIREKTPDSIVIYDLLDPAEVSLSQSTAQIRQHALSMYEDAIEAFRTNNDSLANQVLDRLDDVDRLTAFVTRGFHRGIEDVHEIARYAADRGMAVRSYRAAQQFKRIANGAGRIAFAAVRQSEPPDEEITSELEMITANTRTIVEQSLAGELDQASPLQSQTRQSIETLEQSLIDRSNSDIFLHGVALENIRKTTGVVNRIPTETNTGED